MQTAVAGGDAGRAPATPPTQSEHARTIPRRRL
jgi:hypothetical protein